MSRDKIHNLLMVDMKGNIERSLGTITNRLINMYDKEFFNGEILELLKNTNSEISIVITHNKTGDIAYHEEINIDGFMFYNIYISPTIVSLKRKNFKDTPIGNDNDLYYFQYVFEHELISVLTKILWKMKIETERKMFDFSKIKELHECLMEQYFKNNKNYSDLFSPLNDAVIPLPTMERSPEMEAIGKQYMWQQNSCYIDSLLTILLYGNSSWWRNKIFYTDINNTEYNPKAICSTKSTIDKAEEVKVIAKLIQEQLIEDFEQQFERTDQPLQCTKIMELLSTCVTEMKEGSRWNFSNPATIYNALANLFPSMIIRNVPTIVYSHGSFSGLYYKNRIMYEMWDYMDYANTIEESGGLERVEWDKIDSPTLIFSNGNQITRMNSTENEYILSRNKKTIKIYKKARAFGEYIIHNKYRLVGVIVLLGARLYSEGGTHYICYFRIKNDWYKYDDTQPESIQHSLESGTLPTKGVWLEINYNKPAMYFYERV